MENNEKIDIVEPQIVEKAPKDKKKKTLHIVNIVVNTVFYCFIALLFIFSITQIVGSDEDKVPNILGLGYETVLSDSMKVNSTSYSITYEGRNVAKKDSFEAGDLIFVNTLSKKEINKLKIGDIITFYDTVSSKPAGTDANAKGFLNTHRIVNILYTESGELSTFITQGDCYLGTQYDYAMLDEEQQIQLAYNQTYCQMVTIDNVRAKYIGHWDGVGTAMNWISNPKKGFIIVIIIPTILFLLFEMFMVIKNMMSLKTEKIHANAVDEKEKMRLELEAEKEKMKQELLAQLRAEAQEAIKPQDPSLNEEDKDDSEKSE